MFHELSTVQRGCGWWPRRWGFGALSACGRPPFRLHVRSQWCSFASDVVSSPGQHELMWVRGDTKERIRTALRALALHTDVPLSHQTNESYSPEWLKLRFGSVFLSLNEALGCFGLRLSREVNFKNAITQSMLYVWNQEMFFFTLSYAKLTMMPEVVVL